MTLIFIGLGGFLGALARYGITRWAETKWEGLMPYGTLLANVIGSFLLGLLMSIFLEKNIHPGIKVGLTTGFLGAFTTFSTFGYETASLIIKNNIPTAGLNIFANLFLGLLFVFMGIYLGKLI
ncbi:fluoride efflux transporter CrcB [Halothermothrix orenii]|uniref:Fluoride-specific ion channel FluC n=1 Tax=Halothermothrix orenii (strain H 168 / OCM 544 / DSM 9562) TaxID=373903 RepID=B8CZY9_HALOH|nr:fluoride efflux transporter CrcB [Halothermothrix orenii]ACL70841.1 CrcB protein [Halothermothrix orenii H 168]